MPAARGRLARFGGSEVQRFGVGECQLQKTFVGLKASMGILRGWGQIRIGWTLVWVVSVERHLEVLLITTVVWGSAFVWFAGCTYRLRPGPQKSVRLQDVGSDRPAKEVDISEWGAAGSAGYKNPQPHTL